jgi:hypothetical protein
MQMKKETLTFIYPWNFKMKDTGEHHHSFVSLLDCQDLKHPINERVNKSRSNFESLSRASSSLGDESVVD